MFIIKGLKVEKENKEILKGINLELKNNEIYILMGPNGCGKSTLAKTIAGNPEYRVISGEIILNETNILELSPEERVKQGIFISYQYPPEIPGLNIFQYLRQLYNKAHETNISPTEFSGLLDEKLELLQLPKDFKNRYFNAGFSGGEKKKMEILQMLLLEPKVVILDEIDSGVDIDALKTVTQIVSQEMEKRELTVVFITHYTSLLNYVKPNRLFLMKEGKVVKEGQQELAQKIQEEGYAQF